MVCHWLTVYNDGMADGMTAQTKKTKKPKRSIFRVIFSNIHVFILVLVIPFNIVYHFHSGFAYVDGYFVNYLDFIIHIIDVAVLVFLLWAIIVWRVYKNRLFVLASGLVLCMCILHCVIFRDLVVVYFALRFLMYVVSGIALYTADSNTLKTVKVKKALIVVLALSAVVQSVIAVFQFLLNRSLGMGFLGESIVQVGAFNASSVYLPGGFYLRGYGTFPHPNVLGGFLLIAFSLILNEIVAVGWKKKSGSDRYILISSVPIILAGIFVTWSRVTWVLAVVQLVLWMGYFIRSTGKSIKNYILAMAVFCGLSICWLMLSHDSLSIVVRERLVTQSSLSDVSVRERRQLQDRAVDIIGMSPITGVGVGRFIPALSEDPVYTQSGIRLMQPVHNVFLLVFSEVGLIGVISMAGFGVLLWYKKPNLAQTSLLLSLGAMFVFIGLFDHYLWSLPQGLAIWILLPAVFWRNLVRKPAIEKRSNR